MTLVGLLLGRELGVLLVEDVVGAMEGILTVGTAAGDSYGRYGG